MNIKILDCTLRDGGYINNWEFSDEQVISIINSLRESNVDIIEIGYLNDKNGKEKDSTLFKNINSVNNLLDKLDLDTQKVMMINFGDFDISHLSLKRDTLIDGIRLAFHKKEKAEAMKMAQSIINLGYKLYLQPMITKNYSDREFLSLIQEANKLNIYSFYIVDSFGSMNLKEFQKFLILADNNLNNNIILGYHSHNNMQLAFSNAISMCHSNLNRDIIIDASIYGIGRGAGNLNTELILDYLNFNLNKSYKILPLLEIIDKFLNSLMQTKKWGFSPAQYLSASFNCHPNYATYLVNKNTNHIVGIKKILEKLPNDKKLSFDEKYIETLYQESFLEIKTKPTNKEFLNKDSILLIASGKSVKDNEDIVINKKANGYMLIALNHKSDFECDYYFFSNQKRYDEFKDIIDNDEIIITSNIETTENIKIVLDFSKLVYVDEIFITNVAIVMINYLISKNIEKVEIVGLDGYYINKIKNYSYNETSVILDYLALKRENKILSNALQKLKAKIKIDILTPSIFKKDLDLKTIGVIPARYKSSRFEGKPLCLINGIPMIKRTYLQAKKSKLLDKLVVATDDKRIEKFCKRENIPVVLTSKECLTGTDRIAEVAKKEFFDLYVNIQGDEPVIDPKSIDEVVSEYKKYGDKYIAYNLYKIIDNKDEIKSNTIIKVITNEKDELMYMSRLPIPYNKSNKNVKYKKQVCVYGFTKTALEIFNKNIKTLNEQFEDIEILRFIDMGYKVKMKETFVDSIAVDIVEDIKKVEDYLYIKGLK